MFSKNICSVAYWRIIVMNNLLSTFKQHWCCPLSCRTLAAISAPTKEDKNFLQWLPVALRQRPYSSDITYVFCSCAAAVSPTSAAYLPASVLQSGCTFLRSLLPDELWLSAWALFRSFGRCFPTGPCLQKRRLVAPSR